MFAVFCGLINFETLSIKVHVEFLDFKYDCQSFFLNLGVVSFHGARDHDTNVMGRSWPPSKQVGEVRIN